MYVQPIPLPLLLLSTQYYKIRLPVVHVLIYFHDVRRVCFRRYILYEWILLNYVYTMLLYYVLTSKMTTTITRKILTEVIVVVVVHNTTHVCLCVCVCMHICNM